MQSGFSTELCDLVTYKYLLPEKVNAAIVKFSVYVMFVVFLSSHCAGKIRRLVRFHSTVSSLEVSMY